MTRPLGIIINLNIQIDGIPYVTTFIVLKNNVLDSIYSMSLGKPWLKDAKVTHDQGNNVIIVQGNAIVRTIQLTRNQEKKLRGPKYLFVMICWKG